MPPAVPLESEAVCPGANPLQRSLVADSWEVAGAVLFCVAVWPWCVAALLCVVVADEVDVPAVEVTGAAVATGAEATGVAGTTEVGVGVALVVGDAWCVVAAELRCTVGTENDGDEPLEVDELVGAEGWLATVGPDVTDFGTTTAKAAEALPPVGLVALIT
jgi:hypothetical protein